MTIKYRFARHFTLEEARRVLKENLADLEEMTRLANVLLASGYDIYRHRYFTGMGPNGDQENPPEMDRLMVLLQKFQTQGIQVKSAENGIVDFPTARRGGEEVLLCYRLGEPDLLYWHSLESGFAGRQPLEEL